MEEKHISSVDRRHNHHHDHHKQQQSPSGSENDHAKESHHVWVCHRCGWTYPNPHPSAKHRRNHKKHCGKMEGFPLIASGDRETQGGSSDEELTDDEHDSTDHKKPMPSEEKSIPPQTQTSAPTPDIIISNRNIKSSEADLGKAGQKRGASDNAILNISQTTVLEAKEIVLDQFDQVQGLNLSGTIEPSDNFKGFDWFSFEPKSKEAPELDSSHVVIGDIRAQEFPVKDSHKMSDNPELKDQNNQTDRLLHVPEDSNPPIVQVHPESGDIVDRLGFQNMNDRVKQNIGIAGERQNISEEVKRSLVRPQDTGHTKQPRTFGMPATIPTNATLEHNLEISPRKVGIASILEQTSFKGENSNGSKIKAPLAEKTLASADQKTYELFQMSHQVSGDTIQDVYVSEQDVIHDVVYPSVFGKVPSAEKSPGHIFSQKENPKSLAYEPEKGKLPEHPSSTALFESIFVDNVHPEVTKCVISSQEKSSVEQFVCDKLEDSDISPPTIGVYEIHKNGELEKKIKDPSSEGLDKTSCQKLDLQASSEQFISDQELSCADSLTSEFTKAEELQRVENNAITNPGINEHVIRFLDTQRRNDQSMQRNIIMTDKDIDRNTKATVIALEKLPKASLEDVIEQKSVVSEFLPPDMGDTDLSFQVIDGSESRDQLSREESKQDSNGQTLEQSVVDKRHQFKDVVLDTSIAVRPATTVTMENYLHLDASKHNQENALKYSTDDAWGERSESTENFEPALWEKLLEKDVKETINQETYQQLGNAGTSPVNPFIHEYSLSKEVEPQIFSTHGRHMQTSEQLNDGSTEVERKHPSSTKGVEEDPLVSQLGWFPSFPEVTNESHERKVDNELRTDASEMIPGALELPHTHLRNSPPRSSNAKPEEKKKVRAKSIWSICICCSGAS